MSYYNHFRFLLAVLACASAAFMIFFSFPQRSITEQPQEISFQQTITTCDDWKPINGSAYLHQKLLHEKLNPHMCYYQTRANKRYKCPSEQLVYGPVCSHPLVPEALLRRLSGQTIGFFGDSMVEQTFRVFICSLGDAQCTQVEGPWQNRTTTVVHCHRYNVTIAQQWIGLTPAESMHDPEWFWSWKEYVNARIIVFGIGAHATSEKELRDAVELLYSQFKHGQRRLIWQEYSATHFQTNSSDYEKHGFTDYGAKNQTEGYDCSPHSPEHFLRSKAAYRLKAPLDVLKDQNVTILREYNSTVPRWEQHSVHIIPGQYYYLDCRHFCIPSPVLDLRVERLAHILSASV